MQQYLKRQKKLLVANRTIFFLKFKIDTSTFYDTLDTLKKNQPPLPDDVTFSIP